MKHTFFEVWNFKGINHIKLDFNAHPTSNIYTLVGLNESGKTTILQALNFFTYKQESLNPLNLDGYSIKNIHELIPISQRSNFNDEIKIRVGYSLDEQDKKAITDFLSNKLGFETTEPLNDEFYIEQSYRFAASKLVSERPLTIWYGIAPVGKSKRARTAKKIEGENWNLLHDFLKARLPSVLYFPNFLFEFPDKIYLESASTDDTIHAFYRTIVQDILDATGERTNIKEHILDRAKDGGYSSHNALESVLSKMGSNISRTVFTNWNRIFKRTSGRKEIVVKIYKEKDTDGAEHWYLQLRLKEADEYYSISARSLGFRWFFAFRLLTHYRGFRQGVPDNVLFLFDEPASNLHSTAQSQLLESFAQFPPNASIVYTTHSHHMINPAWLEGAFVVKNEGLEYDDTYDDYSALNTEITLHKYREFAVKHPNQPNYYQPILDVLEYCPSKLENIPNVVMLEGKNDFYTLKYLNELVIGNTKDLNLMSGSGAGSLDSAIRLYLAWGRNFIVILDSDGGGKAQKERYQKIFGILVENKIFSLEDIKSGWNKKTMERLFTEAEIMKIQKASYPATLAYNKKHFNRAIQEAYLNSNIISLSKTTKSNFEKIIEFCIEKLSQ
jgi:AAA15 family ATPase/GTPase